MTVLTLDQWWDATYQMATFHEESGLPFVWLPTPTAWDENLAMHNSMLRSKEMPPRTPLPVGLFWYAWTPSEVMALPLDDRAVWYSTWKQGQVSGLEPESQRVGSPDS